jgi:hypothetical protein
MSRKMIMKPVVEGDVISAEGEIPANVVAPNKTSAYDLSRMYDAIYAASKLTPDTVSETAAAYSRDARNDFLLTSWTYVKA